MLKLGQLWGDESLVNSSLHREFPLTNANMAAAKQKLG